MLLGVIGLAIGIGLGFVFPGYFPETLSDYMGVMLIACADSIIGGLRARALGEYNDSIFISGFFINALLAAAMTYFGKRINLSYTIKKRCFEQTQYFVMRRIAAI